VPYKSNPLAITDLLGGQIAMMIADMATGLPQAKIGALRALGVTTPEHSPLAPDVHSISEDDVLGYEMGYSFDSYGQARKPKDVVSKLNELLTKATKQAAAVQFYEQTGTRPVTSTPEELAEFQREETIKWGTIIEKAGIQKS